MLTITVDNRIHIPTQGLPEWVGRTLCDACTHVNPKYAKQKAFGYSTKGEQALITTWEEEDAGLSFPRGVLPRVREVLGESGVPYKMMARVVQGHPYQFPQHRLPGGFELAPFQEDAIQRIMRRQQCIVRSPTGCVDGDSIVTINRCGKGAKMRLSHVVHMFNGGVTSGRSWDPAFPTMVRAPFPDGTVRLARLLSATCSGVRPVYELRLIGGISIVATGDHRVMTPFGWIPIDGLQHGDFVLTDGGIQTKSHTSKNWYKLRTCREHPFAARRGVNPLKGGWTVAEHRLVAEARDNGMTLDEFLVAVEAHQPGLKFYDPREFVVHHLDEQPRNNDPDNLQVLTKAAHRHEHRSGSIANLTAKLVPVEVESVEYVGERETFDLEVEGATAFIANGMAVHNSGKTTIAIAAMSRIGLTTLIVVWSGALLKQWHARLFKELPGLDPKDVGTMGMGRKARIRPITIAMQQSIYAALKRDDALARELRGYFGLVLCDELQKFAAPTMFGSVDPLASRYRVGFSADETRADGKEFLIYDLFGRVEVDISQEGLIALGFVHDVEVRVVPTGFRADWYVEQKQAVMEGKATKGRWGRPQIDFTRLLEEMCGNEERNALVLRTIVDATEEGGALAISHRVEHCQELDRACVQQGIQSGLMLGTAKWMAAFESTREGLETGRLRVGIGTLQALGQAIDIPAVARGVLITPLVNNRQQFAQVRGRLCRPDRSGGSGKHDAALYVMWDQHVYGIRAVENLTHWNNRVVVLVGGNRWVPAREFIREHRRAARAQTSILDTLADEEN